MNEKRAPWMKWYGADWRADPRLRMCSLAARGLWIELLGFMHEADPYGHLVINGRSPLVDDIAALVGAPTKVVKAALAELERHGVPSFTDADVMFSRRMVRDKAKAEADRANGRGGGNPRLKPDDNETDKPDNTPPPTGGITGGVNPPDKAQRPEARGHSDPNGSGGQPPDPLKALFDFGVSVLTAAKVPEQQARGMLGKWRKTLHDDGKLMALLVSAERNHAIEPLAYLQKSVATAEAKARHGSGFVPPGVGG